MYNSFTLFFLDLCLSLSLSVFQSLCTYTCIVCTGTHIYIYIHVVYSIILVDDIFSLTRFNITTIQIQFKPQYNSIFDYEERKIYSHFYTWIFSCSCFYSYFFMNFFSGTFQPPDWWFFFLRFLLFCSGGFICRN